MDSSLSGLSLINAARVGRVGVADLLSLGGGTTEAIMRIEVHTIPV